MNIYLLGAENDMKGTFHFRNPPHAKQMFPTLVDRRNLTHHRTMSAISLDLDSRDPPTPCVTVLLKSGGLVTLLNIP